MIVPLLAAVLLTAPADTLVLEGGARSPAYAADGRIALELRGDIWVSAGSPAASPRRPPDLVRVTSGAAWDGEPSWTADGTALVFASDRSGGMDIWRIAAAPGSAAEPVALISGPGEERAPAALPSGGVVFVRGSGTAADLWVLSATGEERRLTDELGADLTPAVSPDGSEVAYVAERDGRTELRIVPLEGGDPTTVVDDREAEFPAWSPDGERLAFTTRAGRAGVWVTPTDGNYVNLVSEMRAEPVWTTDGQHLLIAQIPRQDAGYNGDPNRFGDRTTGAIFPVNGALWLVRPTAVPDAESTVVPVRVIVDGPEYNAAVLARVAQRVEESLARRAGADAVGQWNRAVDEHRAAILAAASEDALERAIHDLMRDRPPLLPEVSGRAAVSSAHPLATAAGLEILRQGGNVVDAAVAVSFALGVVEPDASGMGGYGSMVLYLEGMAEPTAIEFLTRVPQAATLENGSLALDNGRIPSHGPVVANVPGTVGGMWLAWERYGSGKVPWADLLAPAIRLAEDGFVLDRSFPTTLRVEQAGYAQYESSREIFFRDGAPLEAGDTLRNPDLAWTLRQVAEGGADAFYRGEIARRMVADLHGKGNAMRLSDLDRYYAVERAPITTSYRGHGIYSSPLATSGGAVLVSKLNLLEQFDDPALFSEDAATLHAMVEAWKLMPSTSGHIADPGLWPVDLEPFVSKDTARARWTCFDPGQSSDPAAADSLPCDPPAAVTAAWGEDGLLACHDHPPATGGAGCRRTGTTAFAIADADGNMISVTQTLGTWGGNFYVTPGLGFLYNDKLGSYSDDPEDYNARIPFARNVTTISPTLVFDGVGSDGEPLLAVGAAGNSWITAAVYEVIVGVIDAGLGPQAALELPRFLPAGDRRPDGSRGVVIQMENGFAPRVVEEMRSLGHQVQIISRPGELRMGYGSAVMVTDDGVTAGADPRRSGAAGAVGGEGEP
ncbi:MAG TPA: gamma-glutamyltransferase [Longimicrobiaceae bacterium]|nr:gamma-glutamyltransferase [Longimicrobiaceae bacterium]